MRKLRLIFRSYQVDADGRRAEAEIATEVIAIPDNSNVFGLSPPQEVIGGEWLEKTDLVKLHGKCMCSDCPTKKQSNTSLGCTGVCKYMPQGGYPNELCPECDKFVKCWPVFYQLIQKLLAEEKEVPLKEGEPKKEFIWLDNVLDAPLGWTLYVSAEGLISHLDEVDMNCVAALSLDYYLGGGSAKGILVLEWLETKVLANPSFPVPFIHIHTGSWEGANKMSEYVRRIVKIQKGASVEPVDWAVSSDPRPYFAKEE